MAEVGIRSPGICAGEGGIAMTQNVSPQKDVREGISNYITAGIFCAFSGNSIIKAWLGPGFDHLIFGALTGLAFYLALNHLDQGLRESGGYFDAEI